MMTCATIYVERGDAELELEVHADFSPGAPARRHGHPDTWCPAEAASVEITAVYHHGKAWDGDLTEAEKDRAEEALREAGAEDDGEGDYDWDDAWENDWREVLP